MPSCNTPSSGMLAPFSHQMHRDKAHFFDRQTLSKRSKQKCTTRYHSHTSTLSNTHTHRWIGSRAVLLRQDRSFRTWLVAWTHTHTKRPRQPPQVSSTSTPLLYRGADSRGHSKECQHITKGAKAQSLPTHNTLTHRPICVLICL